MLISNAGSRQGQAGRPQRQSVAVVRPQPQLEPRPHQRHEALPQGRGYASAAPPARIALVEPGRHHDEGSRHTASTSNRQSTRGPSVRNAHEVVGQTNNNNSRKDDRDRHHGDDGDAGDSDSDDDDIYDDDESYEDEDGADEYRHHFDYDGASSTVKPVQDDEPVYQVRCLPSSSSSSSSRDDVIATNSGTHVNGTGRQDDDHNNNTAAATKEECDSTDGSGSEYTEYTDDGDSADDSDDDDDDDSSSSDEDDDATGYPMMIALCRKWHESRVKVDALSAKAKTLRQERKDLARRLIAHMTNRKIVNESAFGTPKKDYRVRVTVVRSPTSCSVSDDILSAAVDKRLSLAMVQECALAHATKASKASAAAARLKRRASTAALATPHAKHPRHTPPPPPGSDSLSSVESDRAARRDADGSGDREQQQHEEHVDDDDDNNDDDGIVHGVSLAEAIGAALARARREAQEAVVKPRFTVDVVVYPKAEARQKYEPIMIVAPAKNKDDDESAWDKFFEMTEAERSAFVAASKAAAKAAAARIELSREAARWAGRVHEIDLALKEIQAQAGPLRASMAALTVDLPHNHQAQQPMSTTETTDLNNNDNGDNGNNRNELPPPVKPRAKAAEEKRLRHAQHQDMRQRVAAYVTANCPKTDDRGGLAVRFVGAEDSATGRGAPCLYRIRAVERGRSANVGVRRYAKAAVSAAAASLAAVGLDPERAYSPARFQEAFGDRGVRRLLLDALKKAIAAERLACKPPLTRNLVITKAPSGRRSA
jgi:hypothetical protein